MTIQKLVEKYYKHRDSYTNPKYNETQLRSDFLDPLFELLGWDIKNRDGKPTYLREVLLEEGLRAGVNENTKKADYTFRLYSERKFFLEAKKPSVAIERDNDAAKQVRRYGYTAKLKVSVLSNFEYLLIYDCSQPVRIEDNYSKGLLKKYHYTDFPKKIEEIKNLLGKESIYSGNFDIVWKDIDIQIEKHSIDKYFLMQVNSWRKELASEIYKYKNDVSPQQLNDWTQNYLNRILFLRVCEDRNIEEYQSLLATANNRDYRILVEKFKNADKKYNSGLFDQPLCDDIIDNIGSVFWNIIHQLYYPESTYSFSILSSDILGNIYEIYLTDRLVIEDGQIELRPKPENVDKDIVTTPTYIINEILRQTVIPYIEGKPVTDILQMKIADIACGSGAFLLELYQLLQDLFVDYYIHTDPKQLVPTGVNDYKLPFDKKKELLLTCVYGTDKDYNAVEAAKFGLLLKLLENEDKDSIGVGNKLLPVLDQNIYWGNSLIKPQDLENNDHIYEINPFDWQRRKYDVIIGNPPYLKSEDMKNITPYEPPIYNKKYKVAYKQYDKYFLFIEQGLKLLKDNGYLGFIVPSKFTRVGAGLNLRKLIREKKYLRTITSFGANQIFNSKTTYTCILILNKGNNNIFSYSEVSDFFKWRISEKRTFPYYTKSIQELEDSSWTLISPEQNDLYNVILQQSIRLEDIVGEDNIYNGIQTSANSVYIHRIEKKDNDFYYIEKDEREWLIEKGFTRPYFQTSRRGDNLYTYRPFQPNSFVIYPYRWEDEEEDLQLIPLDEIHEIYPEAYKYLMHYKPILANPKRDIKPKPESDEEWYRYGRHQSLESCDVPCKIVVGVLSVGDKYAIDYHRTLVSSGGTAGYCMVTPNPNSRYSIYFLQAILNSKYVEWFASLYGEVFRGQYIARGTKVLKRLPIRRIDFDNDRDISLHDSISAIQEELISIQGLIDSNQNNPRNAIQYQRTFNRKREQLNNFLKDLYELGEQDDEIPLISKIIDEAD